jgi:tetratricopeptide (TPR) repeat protein
VESENDLVRANAVWALAELGVVEDEGARALDKGANDRIRLARMNAAWGLRRASGEKMRTALLDEWVTSQLTEADDPATHHTLGIFYTDRKDFERAIQSYRAAIRLAPGGVPARQNLAMLLSSLKRVDDAIAELEGLRAVAPEFAPATYALGMLYGSKGQWRAAVSAFTACLKLESDYPGALHELAHSYVKLDAGDLANKVLVAALDFPGSRREALATLVSVNLELGRTEDARSWAKRGVAEMPELRSVPRVQELLGE